MSDVNEVFDNPKTFETNLPAEAVAELNQPVEAPKEETPKAPEQPEKPVEPKTEDKADPAETPKVEEEQPRDPKGKFQKAKPIASLLEKKHELETQLEAERAAKAELEAKLAQLSQQPNNASTDDDIKALAEEIGADPEALEKIVALARKGTSPQLPPEVQELLEERKTAKIEQAETEAFNNRVSKLKSVFKDEPLDDPKVTQKLQELAYSTEKAPDGEPYYQKELSELYFGFIKPTIEPGRKTAEPSRGGSEQAQGKVVDFEEISKNDALKEEFARTATSEEFAKFQAWEREKGGNPPIKKAQTV